MPSTYQRYFSLLSYLGISATWPPLSDWISSKVYVDTIPDLRQEACVPNAAVSIFLRPFKPFPPAHLHYGPH